MHLSALPHKFINIHMYQQSIRNPVRDKGLENGGMGSWMDKQANKTTELAKWGTRRFLGWSIVRCDVDSTCVQLGGGSLGLDA